jgi:5-methylcytosine-specific restriction endonuclease McrA
MKKESLHFRMVYPSLSEEQLNSAIQGNLKVYNGDELLRLALSENDLLVFEQAKKDGFIKQKIKDKQGTWKKATTAYFFWCEIHCRTFIALMEQGKFSNIKIELSTATNYGEKDILPNVPEMLGELSLKYKEPWSCLMINHVPNSEVDDVISQVLKITNGEISNSLNFEREIQQLTPDVLKKRALSAKPLPEKQKTETYTYFRNRFVMAYAKKRANGVCQLCNLPAPFNDSNGEPYLETHHIVWLSKGGKDTIENTVALCPNCHRKMHILDLPDDRKCLKKNTQLSAQ